MKKYLLSASMLALASAAPAGAAFAAAADPSADVQAVIVTGTRTTGMKAEDSAAPVEVVGAEALKRTGQPDLMQALSSSLPSFNAQGYGADTAALTLSAALRGLSPNDTLVLVNGKRRHTTANLAVDSGSPYTGSATTDLSFIPVGAIDHIEVLQDGAAAQYGTDAIAGVVNVILKKGSSGGTLSATGGQYFEGDGDTGAISLNRGFDIGDKGFLNVTLENRYHGFSRQGGADHRFTTLSGAPTGAGTVPGVTNVTTVPGYPNMNNIYGDPQSNIYNVFFNAGYDLGGGVSAYAFGSYGNRVSSGFENFRSPTKISGKEATVLPSGAISPGTGATVYPFPLGFSPREQSKEQDYSFTGGVKGELAQWNWDLSSTYGSDIAKISTINSANLNLYQSLQSLSTTPIAPQRNFYDGSFTTTQWTTTLDFDRSFTVGLASPLNVAVGLENRRETFAIGSGDPSSYYGAGAQSYPGFSTYDGGVHARTNYGAYIDLAADIATGWHVDAAGRFEHYSDFGDATVGKLTSRYDFNPMVAVRGTVSTGFRAPTLAEEYYSGTNVSPSFAQVQLPANSTASQSAGFAPLKPEKSTNYSLGLVFHPASKLQITVDAYQIDIKSRIVDSGFLLGSVLNSAGTGQTTVSQAVLNAISSHLHGGSLDSGISYAGIQLFTNGINTQTQGVELTANYASDFGDMGHVDWSLGLNYNTTKITKQVALPAQDVNVAFSQTQLLNRNAISSLTTGAPKEKIVAGAFWTRDKWSVNLRETVYGSTAEWVSLDQTGNATSTGATNVKIGVTAITDLDIGYKITESLRLNIGANNLTDERPTKIPNYVSGGSAQPADGNNVFGEPAQFSPFGINGGYYYGRVTYTF